MSLIEIILLAISLSLDAMVVAIGIGAINTVRLPKALFIAFVFGGLQALMPLLGWIGGSWFKDYLVEYGHIIGFVLILVVALKMLKEAFEPEDGEEKKKGLSLAAICILGIATSIDALVIGITFNFIAVPILLAVSLIGLITFALSLTGIYLGKSSRHLVGTKIEVAGAVVLILLAFKILLF